jgi:hypothetical protein
MEAVGALPGVPSDSVKVRQFGLAAPRMHIQLRATVGTIVAYPRAGESDSRAEGGRGDVWGDVDEALSAVGSEDNEADSCTSRSQDSRSSYSSSSSNALLRS